MYYYYYTYIPGTRYIVPGVCSGFKLWRLTPTTGPNPNPNPHPNATYWVTCAWMLWLVKVLEVDSAEGDALMRCIIFWYNVLNEKNVVQQYWPANKRKHM